MSRWLLIFFLFIAGCTKRITTQMSVGTPGIYHTVRSSDETFPLIAAWYSRSADNWILLNEANPSLKPFQLRKGDEVFIPQRLLRRKDRMPSSFVKSTKNGKSIPVEKNKSAQVPPSPQTSPTPRAEPVSQQAPLSKEAVKKESIPLLTNVTPVPTPSEKELLLKNMREELLRSVPSSSTE